MERRRHQQRRRPVRRLDSTDLLRLFTAARAWFGEPLTSMDLVAAMSRGAHNGLNNCGDAEAWARITKRTQVDVGVLPGLATDAAQAERLGTATTAVICGEGFRVSGPVDRALAVAERLAQQYLVEEVAPWLLAAGVALEDSGGATLALRGSRSPVWLAQLLMRELALCELDGLADLLQRRPNPTEQKHSAADEEPDPDSMSERFFAEASRPVVSDLRMFWSLTPRLCRRRDRVVQMAMALPVAGLAFAVAPPAPAAALTLATAAMISRMRLSLAISAALAVVAWLVGAPWWAATAALLVGVVMYRGMAVARRPFVGRLSGWRSVLRGPARRRAERLLAHAYPVSALVEYERLIRGARGIRRIGLLADAAYTACDAEQYQRALDLATLGLQTSGIDAGPARRYRGRLNVAVAVACVQLEQLDRARAAAKAAHAMLKGTDQRLNHALIAMGEAGEAGGHLDAARSIATAAATRALRRLRWVAACEYVLHLGQVFIRKGRPADAWVCFYHARRLATQRYFKYLGEHDEAPAYGAWRPVVNVMAQTEIGMGEAQMLAGFEFRPEHSGIMPDPSDGLEELKILERPLDLARAHQICAEIQRRNGRHDETIHHLFAALGIIDRNRYLIHEPGTRLRWIKANLQAHRKALAAAHEFNDHTGVCELLEIGRLQGIPAAAKDALAISDEADIPLHPPPRVMIGGQSHLIDADGVSAESEIVDLQILTRRVAGEDAMLLSYWTNEDGCYWSLLGPTTIHSGRIDLNDAELQSALESLHLGLPMPRHGENNAARNARVLAGPYYSNRAQEEKLAIELSVILPAPLRRHLASLDNDKAVSLVICPSPELARVPWPLVAVPEAKATGGPPRRLLELADLHLGLTSALNHEIRQRATDDYTTDVTTVVDPSGEGASATTGGTRSGTELLGAQRMIRRLPPSVRIHGGRWLGDGNPTTLARLKEILHATPKGGAFVFVGHCAGPEPGRSAAEAAIVLAPTTALGPPEGLNAHSLLQATDATESLQFPARVVLAACNTSSADYSDAGEWLSLVPAVHWAGAREVVSSTVSVPDRLYRMESSMIRWLTEETDVTLSEMLLTLQRDALRAWRNGEDHVPPISWAFYLHSGMPTIDPTGVNELAPLEDAIWSSGAIKKLQDGVKSAIGFRHRVLHTNVVSLAHVGYEVDDAASLAAIFIVYPLFIWELLGSGHNPVPLLPGRTPRFSTDWRTLIDAAEAHARTHHRKLVCEIDVLSALLQGRNLSGSRIIRRLANVRHRAVRDRQIREAHAAPQWLHAATPQWLYSAGSKGPERPEVQLLAQVGFTEEWLRWNAIARRRATFDRGFGGYWPIQQRNRRDQAINQARFPPRNV
jgi:hypothetical protein